MCATAKIRWVYRRRAFVQKNRMLLWRRRVPLGKNRKTAAAEVAAAVVFSLCVCVCVSPPLCESVCAAVINSSV